MKKINLLVLFMILFNTEMTRAAERIPLNWELDQVPLTHCGLILKKAGTLFTAVNGDDTRLLARIAYFWRHEKSPAINTYGARPVYRVTTSGLALTPTLEEITSNLIFQIVGEGKDRVLRASLNSPFWGKNKPRTEIPLADSQQGFVLSGTDPTESDIARLNEFRNQALQKLSIDRANRFRQYLTSIAFEAGISVLESREDPNGSDLSTVEVTYSDRKDGFHRRTIYGFGLNQITALTSTSEKPGRWFPNYHSYRLIEALSAGIYIGDAITISFLGGPLKLKPSRFTFEANKPDDAIPLYESELPAWAQPEKP